MRLYAESSAVLAWLFEEPGAEKVVACLREAPHVVSSQLTLVECDRVLMRSAREERLSEIDIARRRAQFEATASAWSLVELERGILDRCRRRFPVEPVRTLDALHLASAAAARQAFPDLAVLSLDQRIRDNAAALGFRTLPA